ncbi:MAG TPA: hypothetical protein VNC16_06275 [Solirubrobacterales bacterium]|jgi:hypothetical protein|nr:hypothetical protein [Solirubrobacterales bacterium]
MLRELDIPADWVASGNMGALEQMLGSAVDPEEARELQGTIFFAFPELEVDGVSIFDSPGVVDWLRLAHRRIPHLVYFLEASPMSGALEGLLRTIALPEETDDQISQIPLTAERLAELSTHLLAASAFAVDKGDDWRPIIDRFLDPLAEKIRLGLIEVVRRELS